MFFYNVEKRLIFIYDLRVLVLILQIDASVSVTRTGPEKQERKQMQ